MPVGAVGSTRALDLVRGFDYSNSWNTRAAFTCPLPPPPPPHPSSGPITQHHTTPTNHRVAHVSDGSQCLFVSLLEGQGLLTGARCLVSGAAHGCSGCCVCVCVCACRAQLTRGMTWTGQAGTTQRAPSSSFTSHWRSRRQCCHGEWHLSSRVSGKTPL